jgi:putative intracellular protease/amidase
MPNARFRVLFVISAADTWVLTDGTPHPTGYWAEEVAEPHRIFSEAGWDLTIATPGAKAPTLDRLSLGIAGGTPWKRKRIERYLDRIAGELATPVALDSVDESDYDLVFYPGGHGPMVDLAVDEISGALLTARLAAGRPLALLCHGPAAILATRNDDGVSPFAGYRVTALSNREELLNSFARKAPWLLEDALKEFGVDYEKGRIPLYPFVVRDRHLFTGQNPASAARLADHLVAELSRPGGPRS